MKANEAPEKIYIFDNPILDFTKLSVRQGSDDIEYIRKDAFIEKACDWLKSKGGFTIGFDGATVRDFLEFINK